MDIPLLDYRNRRIQGLILWSEIPAESLDTYTCSVEECKPRTFISSCWEKSVVEFCHGQRQGKPHPASRLSTHTIYLSFLLFRQGSLLFCLFQKGTLLFPMENWFAAHSQGIHQTISKVTTRHTYLPAYIPHFLQQTRCKEKRSGKAS